MKTATGNDTWLLDALGSEETLLVFANGAAAPQVEGLRTLVVGKDINDVEGLAFSRFDASPGSAFLFRPDQTLAARWRKPDVSSIEAARQRMRGDILSG